MLSQNAAVEMDDVTAGIGIGPNFANDAGIIAIGHEADVLTVGLHGDHQPQLLSDRAHLRLGHPAKREAQIIELHLSRCEQEIALIARRIGGPVQLRSVGTFYAANIMAGGKTVCPQFLRQPEQIGEFHPHIAAHARDRCASCHIFVSEMVDYRLPEPAFMVEHIMCNTQLVGDCTGITNVLPCAASPCPLHRAAVIVQLKRDADCFCARASGECRNDRRINAARHRDDDSLARQIGT